MSFLCVIVISLLKRLKNFSECESGFRRAVDLSYIEFLQLIKIWLTAKTTEKAASGMLANTMPSNINMHDGIIESDRALSMSSELRQTAQNISHASSNAPFTDKYAVSACPNQKLKYVCGTLKIIKTKQP